MLRVDSGAGLLLVEEAVAGVAHVVEGFGTLRDDLSTCYQLPDSMSAARRDEFLSARTCAHRALVKAGWRDRHFLPRGRHREPVWPHGFTGSITHAHGHHAAVAARCEDLSAIGIDLERRDVLTEHHAPLVLRPAELATLGACSFLDQASLRAALFSAKESTYKAWHSVCGVPVRALDIEVTLAADLTFTAVVAHGRVAPAVFEGRAALDGRHVATVAVPARQLAPTGAVS